MDKHSQLWEDGDYNCDRVDFLCPICRGDISLLKSIGEHRITCPRCSAEMVAEIDNQGRTTIKPAHKGE